ncbi:outer membrane beta-barrel protein [Dysgonomonas sp. Marseille-P4677]|uniref:outer membrane beta-barrel protein n=1 Tax=Dysgonomonas sp. Marseille-P4677 TaxID=2364790 RepID=UPI0019137326|nr:outer membrane beta-barrel protein [Dysgonomonas sp. Marseille-P4677]MBK5722636.1 outer membrane beta-barrel protein [Dysgonomonas sp. Marseille-P4677]
MRKKYLIILLFCISFYIGYTHAQNTTSRLTSRKIDKNQTLPDENYKNFRFTFGGGYAYWLGENMKTGNKDLDDFSSELRNGYNLDIEAQYFFHEYIGIGLNGNFAKHSNNKLAELNMKESDNMFFLGATCNFRYENGKWGFYSGLGVGPIFYSGEGEIDGLYGKMQKTVFGLSCSISGEYRLNQTLGLGLKLSTTAGSFKISEIDDRFSVSNLMLTGFISFRTK